MKTSTLLAVVSSFLVLAPSVRAWNAQGHMVAAQIAYLHLTPAVKARCDALIAEPVFGAGNNNSNFVTAACWADDIKSLTTDFNIWHYIDIPFSLDGTPTNSYVPEPFDVVQAINQCVAALQNPATSVSNQAVNLRFLLHFVGDIAQPLHCSTAISASFPGGDAGGNFFSVTGFPNNNPNNLHSLWDRGCGYLADSVPRPLNATGLDIISNKVVDVETAYPYSPGAISVPNPMDWAVEGWNLAQSVTYVGITSGTTPSAGYLATGQDTNKQRMAAAGKNLASLLNAIFTLPIVTTNSDTMDGLEVGGVSLREAIAFATNGSTITFDPGLSGQTILLTNGHLLLDKNLNIVASTLPNGISVDGNGSSRVFVVVSSTNVLTGLTITNGNNSVDGAGGGVFNYFGNLTLNSCTVVGNHASYFAWTYAGGGGVFNYGTLTLNQCTLTKNTADQGGAIGTSIGGVVNLNQCTVVSNAATTATGGGISVDTSGGASVLNINNSIVAGNTGGGSPNISGSFTANGANMTSGTPLLSALGNYGGPTPTMPPLPGSPVIDGCTNGFNASFTNDQRGVGFPRPIGPFADIGAVEVQAFSILATQSANGTITPGGSTTVSFGGSQSYNLTPDTGYYVATLTVDGGSVTPASSYTFNTVTNAHTITATFAPDLVTTTSDGGVGSLRQIVATTVSGSVITFANALSGSNIVLTSGEVLLDRNLTIDGSGLTNGIRIDGNNASRILTVNSGVIVSLVNLTFANGNGVGSFEMNRGGAIYNLGTLTLTRCTVAHNSVGVDGGAIFNKISGVLTMEQCTLSDNHSAFDGGALYNLGASMTLTHCTLSANSSYFGNGGAIMNRSTLILTDTIVGGNFAATPVSADIRNNATIICAGGNIIQAVNTAVTGAAPSANAPVLAPLGDYGGPTQTMPPMPGSPAIDAAGATSFPTDQRGLPRIVGGVADIGAVEGVFNPSFPLINPVTLGNGSFQFSFTNLAGASFTVFASTNVAAPFNEWSNLGAPVESPAGTFQFTDPQATDYTERYYRVRSP